MPLPHPSTRVVRAALLCGLAGLGLQAANRPCTCLTYNVYAFPPMTRDALKALSGAWNTIKGKSGQTDLGGNCGLGITDRLKLDGKIYAQLKPDVIAVQECWKSDNQDTFTKSLPPGYHVYFNPNLKSINPAMMNDGLVFATRGEPFFKDAIVFTDHTGDEDRAQKGALFIGLDNYEGTSAGHPDPPLLLVDTHLQSGLQDANLRIQLKQCQQIAAKIKDILAKVPRLKEAPVVIMGDLNQPYSLGMDGNKQVFMVDRVTWMADAFKAAGVPVDEGQRISQLAARYNIKKIARIDQLKNQGVLVDVATWATSKLDNPKLMGAWGNNAKEWSYCPDATDGAGFQVLDHVFGYRVRFTDWRTLRRETLADNGAASPFGKDKAYSDHAAMSFTVTAY